MYVKEININLFSLRFNFSDNHKARGPWPQKIMDAGIEPREVLRSMVFRGALEKHCTRIGVKFDAGDVEATIQEIVKKYRGEKKEAEPEF